jgi:hypothetical protein
MSEVVKANVSTKSFLVGILLLLCALTFYYFAVLRIDYTKTTLLNLAPHPDATEYFAQAKALCRDGWPSIQIGYEKLPSRYPLGYPLLMLPWLKALPEADAVLAPFRTNQTLGLVLLLAVFVFYTHLAMPLTGGFAVLLLATLPGFFTFCRSSLSEVSASLLIVLAFMFAYLGLKEERRWKIYLSAVLLGLSLNVRLQSVFFAPLLLVMALFPAKESPSSRVFHCAAVMIAFGIAASPVLLMNTIQFHSPFKTGYDFWVPPVPKARPPAFALHYVPINLTRLWSECVLRPVGFRNPIFSLRYSDYSVAHIFGTGTCFVPAFVLLVCLGAFCIQRDRFALCALLSGLTFLAVTLCYALPDLRFYLPLLILLVAVAVLPVRWAAKNLSFRRSIIPALAIFVLFAGACVGYPSRSGYNTRRVGRSQAWDALHFPTLSAPSTEFLAQQHFAKVAAREPGIIVSDIDPVYLNSLLRNSFVAAPIDGNHHYKWSLIWRYDRPEALVLVRRGLEQSIPVYALFVSHDEAAKEQSRLPIIAGHQWHVLNNSSGGAAILQLTPGERSAAESAP